MPNITVLVPFCQKICSILMLFLILSFALHLNNLLLLKNKSGTFNHLDFNYSRDALQLVSYLWSAV